jgi:hypothetical protein
MKIVKGSRHQFGRCAFSCEDDDVTEINFNGVKVRLCKKHASILANKLLTATAPVQAHNERM